MSIFSVRNASRGVWTSDGLLQRSVHCRHWFWGVVGVWALVSGGCSCHATDAPSQQSTGIVQPVEDFDGPPPPPKTKPTAANAAEAKKPVKAKDDGVVAAPPKPARPIDLADWKPNDYDSALRAGDPRFLAAVGWLGEHSTDKEIAGDQLVALLDSSVVALDMAPPVAGMKTKVTEAIVAALGVNGSPRARESLERLVAGTLKTADNQAAATAALKALLSQPRPENEELFFRVLTTPEQPATADRAAPDPQKLQQTAISMINSTASESFRVRLAKCMTSADIASAVYEKLWALLMEPRPENLAAHVVLYESDRPDASERQLLEQLIAVRSANALARLLGVPPPKERLPMFKTPVAASIAGEPPKVTGPSKIAGPTEDFDGPPPPSPKLSPAAVQKPQPAARLKAGAEWRTPTSGPSPYTVAELLWNSDFTTAVERRLRGVDGLEEAVPLTLLAATLPSQPVRAALLRALEKFWEEGPKSLDALAESDTALSEPGFLLLVKRLHRKDAPANSAATAHGVTPSAASGKTAKAVTDREAKQQAERDAKQQRIQTAQEWMAFSDDLVRAMCQRFYTAALAKKTADSDSSDLPFAAHPNAQIVASYAVDWPDGLQGKLADLPIPPMRVHYVRIEQKARPSKLLAYYRRQLPSGDEHLTSRGVWLDDLNVNKEQGTVRSIDVLITRPIKSMPLVLTQEQEVVVEILAVECAWSAERNPLSSGK